MKWISIGLAAALATTPSWAVAAENITCIDEGYTQGETATFDRFYDGFQVSQLQAEPPPEIAVAITRRAGDCADAHSWPAEAIEDAFFYRFAGILRTALERRSPLTPAQMRRVSEAIASADQNRLARIIGLIEDAAMNGEPDPEHSESDTMFMGRLFIRSGVPMTEANAEYVGALLAARMMGDRRRQSFAAR